MLRTTRLALCAATVSAATAHGQWRPHQTGTTAEFRSLSVPNASVVWAGGRGGWFARTTDAGKTWRADTVPGASSLFFTGVHAADSNTAHLLGTNFDGGAAKIFRTDDGGRTWKEQFALVRAGVFFDGLAFWDRSHGIAFSDPVDGAFLIVTTSDGGSTWTQVPRERIPPPLEGEAAFAASGAAIAVRGTQHVWFATGGGRQARVYHSADRGRSWTVFETPLAGGRTAGIFALAFNTASNGIAVGGDYQQPRAAGENVLVTGNGGRSWRVAGRALPAGVRYGVSFVPGRPSAVVAVGPSGSGYSLDGGASWVAIDTMPFNTVRFISPTVGWAAGTNGRIARFAGRFPSPGSRRATEKPRNSRAATTESGR